MKRQNVIIITALSICALIFGVYFGINAYVKSGADPEDEPKNSETLLEINNTDKISSFEIKGSDISLSIYRRNGRWHLTGNDNIPISKAAAEKLIAPLKHVTALRIISETHDNLSEYGLDNPAYTVSFTLDGTDRTYSFGNENKYYGGYYFISSASDSVSIVSSSFLNSFIVELESLIEFDTLPDLSNINSICLTDKAGVTHTMSSSDNSEDFDKLCALLATLDIDRFIDCGKEVFETYNLENPVTLVIDDKITIRLAEGESAEIVYLVIGENELIYLVKCQSLEELIEFINY